MQRESLVSGSGWDQRFNRISKCGREVANWRSFHFSSNVDAPWRLSSPDCPCHWNWISGSDRKLLDHRPIRWRGGRDHRWPCRVLVASRRHHIQARDRFRGDI